MSTTTAPNLKRLGVDKWGKGWRVRISFPGIGRHAETGFPSEAAAVVRAIELHELKAAGDTPAARPAEATLRSAAEALLARKAVAGKRGPLRAKGLEWWRRSLKPWIEGPFAERPLSALRRDQVEDAILARAAIAPTSARNERQALLAALEYAAGRGARFDLAILRIPPVQVTRRRERRALTAAELEFLAEHVVDYARRLVLAQGTIGNRVGELFLAAPEHVDLDGAELFVPAANCKEGRDKTIPLTAEEVELLREQRGGLHVVDTSSSTAGCPTMPTGSSRLFTTRTGTPWRHTQFERLVWSKAIRRAAAAWRAEHELGELAATPFEWYVDGERRWLTTHDLRSTAVTLMREAGISREDAAERVGHADGGKLLGDVYDLGDRTARVQRAIAAAAPQGLRRQLVEPAPRATTRATAGSTNGTVSP